MFQILSWTSIGLLTIGLVIILALVGSFGSRAVGGGALVLLVPLLLTVALAVTTFMAASKRSGGARWAYIGLATVTILLILLGMAGGGSEGALNVLLNLLQIGLMIGAIVFLLQADSAAWFAQGRQQFSGYGGGHGNFPPGHGYPPQQGGGYPPQPQGGGYPPQQGGGYPPQQGGGYPPQQGGGYPPQGGGGGYPPQQGQPQQGGYPPQQGAGYPPQQGSGGYPPPPGGGGGYPPQ